MRTHTAAVEPISSVCWLTSTSEITLRVTADGLRATSAVAGCALVDICISQSTN